MQTTDNHELIIGHHYYTESGEEVCLVDWMDKPSMRYLVQYLYEGEAMRVECYGNGPVEVTAPYEIYGEATIIKHIFKNAPKSKIEAEYKKILNKSESLSLSIGLVSKLEAETKHKLQKHQATKAELEKCIKDLNSKFMALQNEVNGIELHKKDLTTQVERLNDRVDELAGKPLYKELGRLRERDFKLTCLENGGVDNWEFYDISLEQYRAKYD